MVKPFVHGGRPKVAPTGIIVSFVPPKPCCKSLPLGEGGPPRRWMRRYRLKYLHRNREVTQSTVGADSISARVFWLNRLFAADRRGRRSLQCMAVTIHSTEAVRLPRLSVGEGLAPPVLFRLNRSPRRTTDGRPYGVWWQLFVPPQPCCKSLPLGEGGRQVVKSSATLFRNKI